MKYTLFNQESKKIICIGECPDDRVIDQIDDIHEIIEGHYPPDLYYIDANYSPILKDERPDDDSDWDEATKKWKFNKQEARQKLKKKVERERELRDGMDISYDGKNIQADAEARANIHGKLAEIVAAQAFGQTISPLIWRDSDNIDHAWTDMLIYKAWLQGLVMAIAARSTALYQASWVHKAAIAALDTVSEIKNYDITIGW
jgi:hypothetical protein